VWGHVRQQIKSSLDYGYVYITRRGGKLDARADECREEKLNAKVSDFRVHKTVGRWKNGR
jgi:hypothetical protein